MSDNKKRKPKYKPTDINISNMKKKEDSIISQSGKFKIEDLQAKIGKNGIIKSSITPTSPFQKSEYSQNPPTPDELGFEDFQIMGNLGSGASASVKRVVHQKSKKTFAMKEVIIDKNDIKPKVITAEFKALYDCQCPYIIKMYDAFYREGRIYMIIEYMNCGSLEDVVKICSKIPENVLAKMAKEMLLGLDYLHTVKKTVHRDIKPANILTALANNKGTVKLADFGMAGQKDQNSQSCKFETFQGTFTYMSPERIKGQTHGFDSDIWSIGLTVAQCALGRFPFQLQEFTIWEMMKQIEANNISTVLPKNEFSEDFMKFVIACMQFNPKDRPTPKQLLEFDWIKQHENTSPSIGRWLFSTYLPLKKKEKERKEKEEKEKRVKEQEQQQQGEDNRTKA